MFCTRNSKSIKKLYQIFAGNESWLTRFFNLRREIRAKKSRIRPLFFVRYLMKKSAQKQKKSLDTIADFL